MSNTAQLLALKWIAEHVATPEGWITFCEVANGIARCPACFQRLAYRVDQCFDGSKHHVLECAYHRGEADVPEWRLGTSANAAQALLLPQSVAGPDHEGS